MASKRNKVCRLFTTFMLLIYLLPVAATNFDCGGKPFYCLNSTHFMICVDLGAGVTKTVDDFVIQCPSTTSCHERNQFECEYQLPTTTELVNINSPVDETNDLKSTVTARNDMNNTVLPLDKTTILLNEYSNTSDINKHTDHVPDINTSQQNEFLDILEKTNTNNKASIINEYFDYLTTTSETQINENIPHIKILNNIDFIRPLEPSEPSEIEKLYHNNSFLQFFTKLEHVIPVQPRTSNISKTNKINFSDDITLDNVMPSTIALNPFLDFTNLNTERKNEISLTTQRKINTDLQMEDSHANGASFNIKNRSLIIDLEGQIAKVKEIITSSPFESNTLHAVSKNPERDMIIPKLLINSTYTSATNNNKTMSSTIGLTTTEDELSAHENIGTPVLIQNFNNNDVSFFDYENQTEMSLKVRLTSTVHGSISLDSNIEDYTTTTSPYEYKLPFEILSTPSEFTLRDEMIKEIVTENTLPTPNANNAKQMPDTTKSLEIMPTIINDDSDYKDTTENPEYRSTFESGLLHQTMQYKEEITLSPIEEYILNVTTPQDFHTTNDYTYILHNNNSTITQYNNSTTLSSISVSDRGETSTEYETIMKEAKASNIVTSNNLSKNDLSLAQPENPTKITPDLEPTSNIINSMLLLNNTSDMGNVATTVTVNNIELVYESDSFINKITTPDEFSPQEQITLADSPSTVIENSYFEDSLTTTRRLQLMEQLGQNKKVSTATSQDLLSSKVAVSGEISSQDSNTESIPVEITGSFLPASVSTAFTINTKEAIAIGGNSMANKNEREIYLVQYEDATKLSPEVAATSETFNSIALDNIDSDTKKSAITENNLISVYNNDDVRYGIMITDEVENTRQVSPFTVTENPYFGDDLSNQNSTIITTTDSKVTEPVIQNNKNQTTSPGQLPISTLPVDIYSQHLNTIYPINETELFLPRDDIGNITNVLSPFTLTSTDSTSEQERYIKKKIRNSILSRKDFNEKEMFLLQSEEGTTLSPEVGGTNEKNNSTALPDAEKPAMIEMSFVSVYDTGNSTYEITTPDELLTSEVTLPVDIYLKNQKTDYPLNKTVLILSKNNFTNPFPLPTLALTDSNIEQVTNAKDMTGGSIAIKKKINEKEMFLLEYEQGTTLSQNVGITSKTFNSIALEDGVSDAKKSSATEMDLKSYYDTNNIVNEIMTTTELPRLEENTLQVIPPIISENSYYGSVTSNKKTTPKSVTELVEPVLQTIKISSQFPGDQPVSGVTLPVEISRNNSTSNYLSDETDFFVTNRKEAIEGSTGTREDSKKKEMFLIRYENISKKPTYEGMVSTLQNSVSLDYYMSNTEKSTVNEMVSITEKENSTFEPDIITGFETNISVTEHDKSILNVQSNENLITTPSRYDFSSDFEIIQDELLKEHNVTGNKLNTDSSLAEQDQDSFANSWQGIILTSTEKTFAFESNRMKPNLSTLDSAYGYFNGTVEKTFSSSHYSNTFSVNLQRTTNEPTESNRLITETSKKNYITNQPNKLYYTNQIITEPKTDGMNIGSYATEGTTENKSPLGKIIRLSSQNAVTAIPNIKESQYPSILKNISITPFFKPTLGSNKDEFLTSHTQNDNNTNTKLEEMEPDLAKSIHNTSNTSKIYDMSKIDAINSSKAKSFHDDNKMSGVERHFFNTNFTINLEGTPTNSSDKHLFNKAEQKFTSTIMTSIIDFVNEKPTVREQYVRNETVTESNKIIEIVNNSNNQFIIGETAYIEGVPTVPILVRDSLLLRTITKNNLTNNDKLNNNDLNKQQEERIANKRSVLLNTEATAYRKQLEINNLDRFITINYTENKPFLGKNLTPDHINHETTSKSQKDVTVIQDKNIENNRTTIMNIQKANFSSNNLQKSNYEPGIMKRTHEDETILDIKLTPTVKSFVTEIINAKTTSDGTKLRNTTSVGMKANIGLFTCKNLFRGRYPDKNDCRRFYICIGKVQPVYGECPANTVFSNIKKQCTKNLSHCIRNNQFHCVQEGRFSDVLRTNIYYICVSIKNRYVRFQFQCENGYYLNKTSVRCVANGKFQSLVTSISTDSDSKKGSDQSTVEKKSKENKKVKDAKYHICTDEGKFPNADDCRKYYVCSKTSKSVFRRKTKKCDSDEVFHREKKKCVDSESYECK